MTNWITAAEKYRADEEERQRKESVRLATSVRDEVLQDSNRRRELLTDIDHGTVELEQFLQTEGQAAMELLRASKRHIIFGEINEGGGFGEVYFFDGNGLHKSTEAMGMWVAYSKDVPKPKLSHITARQAVEAAVHHGGKKAVGLNSWLRSELDKIANAALKIE